VSAVPEYQRARRPEHKEERREAILAAARALAAERAVREVSLGDIARRVGLAKSNLLRYFESREEIFLQLLVREWDAWRVDAAGQLGNRPRAPDKVAAVLAHTLAERPLFCDLMSELASVLERNVSASTVRAFKAKSLDMVDDIGAVVAARVPQLAPADAREVVAAALVFTAGLWPMANPASHVSEMYADVPELTRAHVDFEVRLRRLLATLITGFLA
jgi:AcrR family transcriptional regulator